VPALPPYIIEPIWEQFEALLPEHEIDHPLGCHRRRIPDRVVFEKLVQILVFGCAYEKIADDSCSESTLRRRRDEWIELGLVEALRRAALEAYDRALGLEPSEVAVDCCVTKAPCGGERSGRSPVDRRKGGLKRSVAVDGRGIPLGGSVTAPANRHDSPLLIAYAHTMPPFGFLTILAKASVRQRCGSALPHASRRFGAASSDRRRSPKNGPCILSARDPPFAAPHGGYK
jgi:transposase